MSKLSSKSLNVLTIAILGSLAACSDAMGPEGPGAQPAPQISYNLTVETRYIDVEGSCDKDIFGDQVPGEFQYRIEIHEGGVQRGSQESRGYNKVTGEHFQRNRGTSINFTNRDYNFSGLARSAKVKVHFNGAEWDGVRKDNRMANRGNSENVPFKLGTDTHRLGLGPDPDECALGLYYDATWTEVRN